MVNFVECFRHIECANVRSADSLNNFVNDAAYSIEVCGSTRRAYQRVWVGYG